MYRETGLGKANAVGRLRLRLVDALKLVVHPARNALMVGEQGRSCLSGSHVPLTTLDSALLSVHTEGSDQFIG